MGLRGEQEDLLAPIWLWEEEALFEEAKGLIAATRMAGGVAEIESASSVDRAARVVDQVSSPGRPPSEKVETRGRGPCGEVGNREQLQMTRWIEVVPRCAE